MQASELLLSGKTKDLFATADPQTLVVRFKDSATAYGGLIRGEVPGKGIVNNRVSAYLMRELERAGIPTQLLAQVDERSSMIRRLDMLPLEVVIRNVVAGSLVSRLGLPEGTQLAATVREYYFKSDELDDPLVNEYHIAAMHWAAAGQLDEIARCAEKANEVLRKIFAAVDIELVDFKLEFGCLPDGTLALGNEISLDTCRLWDLRDKEKLDRDCFAESADAAENAYQKVAKRLFPGETGSGNE